MNRRQAVRTLGAAFGVCLATRPWRRAGAAEAAGQSGFSEIERRLKETIEKRVFDGIGLLLCTGEKTLFKKAFGADTTETTHLLASATKIASATAMMTLVDQKLIALDDPIRKHLPQFGKVRGAITIRQLLAQTHGLPFNHRAIPAPQMDNGMTLEQAVNQIAREDSVDFAPGSKQSYQPAVSYHIMGRIAEVVTSQDWATLFQKRVAGPLEMHTFTYGETKNPRIGGGAKCALQDYGNLLQMYLARGVFKGRRVLSVDSVSEMQQDQSRGAPFAAGLHVVSPPKAYGLTWWIDLLNERKEPEQFSCGGAFGAIPWLNPMAGYAGFLLVQKRLPEAWKLYRELSQLLNSMKPGNP
jgi:CubicO group peptidase (beta-lactamase class C family)